MLLKFNRGTFESYMMYILHVLESHSYKIWITLARYVVIAFVL